MIRYPMATASAAKMNVPNQMATPITIHFQIGMSTPP